MPNESSKPPYGATRAEWETLYKQFPARLLPAIGNPNIEISPHSTIKKLKDVAKTPTEYNAMGQAAGLTGWTQRVTTPADVRRWLQNSDYNVLLATGYKPHDGLALLALDLDLSRAALIAAILAQLDRHTDLLAGVILPRRRRGNSPRVLLPVVVTGVPERLEAIHKRIFAAEQDAPTPNPDGTTQPGKTHNVELLAWGNQFVACGTHPSGERYHWEADHPALGIAPCPTPPATPSLTVDEFEAIWSALVAAFSIGEVVRATPPGKAPTEKRDAKDGEGDPVAEHLHAHGWATSTTNDGRVNILCPFRAEHTDGEQGAESSTQYFPAGIGGFHNGHFKCLHAHCLDRSDRDFLDAIGYDDSHGQFVDETTQPPEPTPTTPDGEPLGNAQLSAPLRAMFPYTDKRLASLGLKNLFASDTGRREQFKNVKINKETNIPEIPAKVFSNIVEALRTPSFCGFCFRFDSFGGFFCVAPINTNLWRAAKDPGEFISVVQMALESKNMRGFTPAGREITRAIITVCKENTFDSLADRVNSFVWDGVPRVGRFFEFAFGLDPSDYLTAVAWYVFTVLAGRGVDPGTAAQCMLVLIGGQNKGKTKLAELIALALDLRESVSFRDDPERRAMRLCGRNVIQIDEMRGIETQASEEIKSWISAEYDSHRILYTGTTHREYRRFLLVGSSNKQVLFHDETGNRRFLPVKIPADRRLNEQWVIENRDQLYAEALQAYINNGRRVMWENAVALADGELTRYMSIADHLTYQICEYLTEPVTAEFTLDPEKQNSGDRLDPGSLLRFHTLRAVDRVSLLTYLGFYKNGEQRISTKNREAARVTDALTMLGVEGSEHRHTGGYRYKIEDRGELLRHIIKYNLVHKHNVHNRMWLDGHAFDVESTVEGLLGISHPSNPNTIN